MPLTGLRSAFAAVQRRTPALRSRFARVARSMSIVDMTVEDSFRSRVYDLGPEFQGKVLRVEDLVVWVLSFQ